MAAEATIDHRAIREWAHIHGAHPAERLPNRVDSEEPVLTLIFHRSAQLVDKVIPLTWEEFFERFDRLGLSFIGTEEPPGISQQFHFLLEPAEASLRRAKLD